MALPAVLQRLKLPVIAAPMFIAGNPQLVIEQCKAGIVGSFPALNARPKESLDAWLSEIEQALAGEQGAVERALRQPAHKLQRSRISVQPGGSPGSGAAPGAFSAWRMSAR